MHGQNHFNFLHQLYDNMDRVISMGQEKQQVTIVIRPLVWHLTLLSNLLISPNIWTHRYPAVPGPPPRIARLAAITVEQLQNIITDMKTPWTRAA